MRTKLLMALAGTLGAAVCGITPLEVDPRLQYKPNFDQSQVSRGYEFAIFLKSEDPDVPVDSNGFVSQAACSIKNDYFGGNVPVNMRVVVPVYSYKPSPLRLKCTSGNKSFSATHEAEMVVTNTLGNAVGVAVTDNLAGAIGADGAESRSDIAAQGGDWSYKYIYLDL